MSLRLCPTGGLFPTGSHEYEVFRFALAQHQDVPKLVPQVDMVDTASSFSMTYACKFTWGGASQVFFVTTNVEVAFNATAL